MIDLPDTSRLPRRLYRIAWTRHHWRPDAEGRRRWKTAWRTRHSDAHNLTISLQDAGAVVLLDDFTLEHRYRRPQPHELEELAQSNGLVEGIF